MCLARRGDVPRGICDCCNSRGRCNISSASASNLNATFLLRCNSGLGSPGARRMTRELSAFPYNLRLPHQSRLPEPSTPSKKAANHHLHSISDSRRVEGLVRPRMRPQVCYALPSPALWSRDNVMFGRCELIPSWDSSQPVIASGQRIHKC
jgi:hypothetical protein